MARHFTVEFATKCLRQRLVLPFMIFHFTDRISDGDNAIASVRLSVRLFPLYLRIRLTFDLERLRVSRS